jgi:quinoprotein dehydrogenase-associated probable ABC transporter substrate-binding protein
MWINNKRHWLAYACAASLLSMPVAHAGEQAFKVCADPNNPPLSDQKGQGLENKIAELFAKDLGQKLEYTWFPQRLGFIRSTLKAKLPDSEEYKCDVVMGVPTGYELTATTKPYYRSTYALVYAKGKGWDDIKAPADLDKLPADKKSMLRIAMFDGAPGTTWLLNHKLVDQGVPYQTMTGDASVNTAQILEKDFQAGKIDMVIIWGPIAGYLVSHNPNLTMLPMKSEAGLKFDFPMSMGVRIPDKDRKAQLEGLIDKHAGEIQAVLQEFKVPLVDEKGEPVAATSSK